MDANKVRVRFSKLMSEDSNLLLDCGSYDILVDGKSVGPVKNVEVSERQDETRLRSEKEEHLKGVRSVVIQCSSRLMGSSLQVLFRKSLSDIDGNMVAVNN